MSVAYECSGCPGSRARLGLRTDNWEVVFWQLVLTHKTMKHVVNTCFLLPLTQTRVCLSGFKKNPQRNREVLIFLVKYLMFLPLVCQSVLRLLTFIT